jgi:hypothetical protein
MRKKSWVVAFYEPNRPHALGISTVNFVDRSIDSDVDPCKQQTSSARPHPGAGFEPAA